MFIVHRQEIDWGGRLLALETGKIARQADGAVMASYGDTRVLCTVVVSKDIQDSDFLPLSVHYQEKAFAAGKVPGGFRKRESKPSDAEVLASRLIDRMLRAVVLPGFHCEIQVMCTVFSFDEQADPVMAALIGASAALALSGVPLKGVVAALRLGYDNTSFVVNPNEEGALDLDLVLAATKDGIVMIESAAKEKSEDFMLKAFDYAARALLPITDFIQQFIEKVQPNVLDRTIFTPEYKELFQLISQEDQWEKICAISDQKVRDKHLTDFKEELLKKFQSHEPHVVKSVFYHIWHQRARQFILAHKRRLDGRAYDKVREIMCEVGVLPRVHGSALFTRGETQALVTVTWGGRDDAQLVDDIRGTYRDMFMLQYNFPPYSVGEVGRIGSLGRRELGHGKLAWRALQVLVPSKGVPYSLRVVSDVTESNGSSSMATVCGGSLALMEAGLSTAKPLAGIAMGMIREGEEIVFLSDISGLEDGLGDMDFKVAGTAEGITALQMDLKGKPLSQDLMQKALAQAQEGRLHILQVMSAQTLSQPKKNKSPHAPVMTTIKIPVSKIRDLIGTGGKVIRELCESTNSKIDVSDDGTVHVFSLTAETSKKALSRIKQLVSVPVVGEVYQGTVVRIVDFGAFVDFGFTQDGMVHISEVTVTRLEDINTMLSVGDKVRVKLIGFDARGRVKLSIKQAQA